ncbi:MAG: hypothetical protein K0S36_408 [Nitrosospira multiformis]|jgi:hypothetical protein|nr:hypothetical protein [Nitrosospira multiformis]
MSSEATAYEAYPTMEDEWNRKRQLSEMQRIEQGARRRQPGITDYLMQLERQNRIEQRDKELRHRQLEVGRYRAEWR